MEEWAKRDKGRKGGGRGALNVLGSGVRNQGLETGEPNWGGEREKVPEGERRDVLGDRKRL